MASSHWIERHLNQSIRRLDDDYLDNVYRKCALVFYHFCSV